MWQFGRAGAAGADVWDIYAYPMFASVGAAAGGWFASRMIPTVPALLWWRMAVIGAVGGVVYVGILWQLARPQLQEIWNLGAKIFMRGMNREAEQAVEAAVSDVTLHDLVRPGDAPDEQIDLR